MGKKNKKSQQRREGKTSSLKAFAPTTSTALHNDTPPNTEPALAQTIAVSTAHIDEPCSARVSAGSPPRALPALQSNSQDHRQKGGDRSPARTNHALDTGSTSSWPPPNHDDTFGTALKTVKGVSYVQQQKQYTNDTDEEHDEQSPLMRENSRDSNYSSSSDASITQQRHLHQTPQRNRPFSLRRAASRASESLPRLDEIRTTTRTWLEWSEANGLHPRVWTKQTAIKASMLAVFITLIVLSFTVFRVQDHIKDILRYIDQHKRIGAIIFVASYSVACLLFLPGSLFTIGAGFLFKPFPLALGIVLLGDVFAAVGSFVFGRYIFYDWVKGMMSKHPKFSALDEVIKDDGWKIVVMLRLTPIPFNLITYFFSITSIKLWTVVWATCVGVFPGTCIGIWIGSLLKGLSGIDNPDLERKNIVIIAMNMVLIGCCILTLSIFGRRSLRKAMKRLDQHQALTSFDDVEVVIEGAADLIHAMEDDAGVPSSRRNPVIERLATDELEHPGHVHHRHLHHRQDDLEAGTAGRVSSEQDHHRPLLGGGLDYDNDDETDEGRSSATLTSTGASTQTMAVSDSPSGTATDKSLLDRLKKSKAGDRLSRLVPGRRSQDGTRGAAHPQTQLASSGFTRGEKMTFIVIAVVAAVNLCVCLPLYFYFSKVDG